MPRLGGVALGRAPCLVTAPAVWQQAMTNGTLWRKRSAPGMSGAPTPSGTPAVLDQVNDGGKARLALVGAGGRVVERIGTLDRPAGAQFTYNAISDRYVAFVWVLTNQQAAQSLWKLYLFDRRRHRLTVVDRYTAGASGQPSQSGWVDPILSGRRLYWIHAVDTGLPWGGSEVRAYDLRTGATRTLYRGLSQALAVVNGTLIYTRVAPHADTTAAEPSWSVGAAADATGRAVTAPAGITAGPDNAVAMRGSDGTLIWSMPSGSIRGWNASWGRSITLLPGLADWPIALKIGLAGAGYPRIYKHFVTWAAGTVWVLDLTTNSFAALTNQVSGEDLSGSRLEIEQYTTTPTTKDQPTHEFDQTVIDLAKLSDLGSCRA